VKRGRIYRRRLATSAIGLVLVLSGIPSEAGESPSRGTTPAIDRFESVFDAVAASLSPETAVVAFGELHQRTTTARSRSTLSVFTSEVLPPLAPRLSHLVVETWMTTGKCGEVEKAAVAEVETKTERPHHVESELVVLLTRAKSLGVSPQILSIDCASYQDMIGAGGGGGGAKPALDFEKTLAITTQALSKKILAVLDEREKTPHEGAQGGSSGSARPAARTRRLVAVYGGALHNDLLPDPELAAYSFASQVERRVPGGYVEIDLFLPALIDASAKLLAREPWFRVYRADRPPKGWQGVLRLTRAPGSYVIVPSRAAVAAGGSR